ncbi:prolipoprotein diacylglyceryl transferase [Planobispora takensis]|uniref:prolipoprotein diacylglyceryl transferase n=1 Tax=Planobispora takensis TaxID=1367882 RepID=UPI0035A21FE2
MLGVVVAVVIGERRWRARGGAPGTIVDLAVWAVPFGLIGGRLYHVITDWQLYFAADAPNRPIEALYIWNGGLGIWGAIALGAVGVWIGCRTRGISLTAVADTVAPGIAVAQAIGRWGNYFNQELFGSPTDLPWGLEIDPDRPGTIPGEDTYHPTFLYESIWDLGLALVLVWAGRKFALRHGRLFALYVAGYTVGRFWIEGLRVDTAHHILGLRLNQWTSIILLVGALAYFWLNRDRTDEESLGTVPEDENEKALVGAGVAAGSSAAGSSSEPAGTAAASTGAAADDDPVDPAHPADQADAGAADGDGDGDGGEPVGEKTATAETGETAPEESAPAEPASVEAAPGEPVADGTTPDESAESAADETASDETAPAEAEPAAGVSAAAADSASETAADPTDPADPAHPADQADEAEGQGAAPAEAPSAPAGEKGKTPQRANATAEGEKGTS